MDRCISLASIELRYNFLKEEQKRSIMKGNDVFVILPTGFGKTVCYACQPMEYDLLHHRGTNCSVVLFISPLTALMKDQVQSLKDRGIRAGHINSDSAIDIKEIALSGAYEIFMLVGKGKEIVRNDVPYSLKFSWNEFFVVFS